MRCTWAAFRMDEDLLWCGIERGNIALNATEIDGTISDFLAHSSHQSRASIEGIPAATITVLYKSAFGSALEVTETSHQDIDNRDHFLVL